MKSFLKSNAAVLIFAVVFSLSPFCPNIHAQTSTKKNQTFEKDKREVQKFVDSFIKILAETQDITQVPERFFAPDFGKEFCQNDSMIEKKLAEQISRQDHLKYCNLVFNSMYLGIAYRLGKGNWDEIKKIELEAKNRGEDSENELYSPPEVLKLLKNTWMFTRFFNGEEFIEIQTFEEFNTLIAEMESINAAMRAYLKKHTLPKRKSVFWEEMKDVKNTVYWKHENGVYWNVDKQGRRYVEVGGYYTSLKIVKINNELKVAAIELLQD